ncbi:MAG: hypothetical protein WC959_08645 [Kiritimatiellales bacterium]
MNRLRIFAGPNGSGKSSLYMKVKEECSCGLYLNPDKLQLRISNTNLLDLNHFGIFVRQSDWDTFYKAHKLHRKAPLLKTSYVENNILVVKGYPASYDAAILTDFLRSQLIKTGRTFSFETVFSHPSKLDFMRQANQNGYHCYLYFAAISSQEICIERVRQRVIEGGHDVLVKKIRKRYEQSLENLFEAIQLSYRAYLFDNSQQMKLVAEMLPDRTLKLIGETSPVWLEQYVLKKLPDA